jgi:hypothetical protein
MILVITSETWVLLLRACIPFLTTVSWYTLMMTDFIQVFKCIWVGLLSSVH